ncbi:hypothetical protein COOONC_26714 [Cooperia oncophora]
MLESQNGIVFLPTPLLPTVRALRGPPVPAATQSTSHTTWMQGPFKNMWCKWKVEELRTTNLAEAFHRL